LSGLFRHYSGSFGVKLQATLRLIEAPKETGHASFVFDSIEAAARALSAIGRSGAAEEAYVFDPETTRKNLRSEGLLSDANVLVNVMRSETSWWRGLKEGFGLIKAGRRFLPKHAYSLHVTCAARSLAALEADLDTCRQAALQHGGAVIPHSIPKAVRANLFPPLDGVVGGEGERWAALNAKVAHSDAEKIIRASAERLASYRERMQAEGVWMSHLLIAISNHAFSFEPVFHWHDEWLPVHQRYASESLKQKWGTPPAKPGARELVAEMRAELVALFAELGAASNQLGKTYPYRSVLRPETAALFGKLKAAVDPAGLMNPGALD
jgi:FAD/FMN-containing dehydrogenase